MTRSAAARLEPRVDEWKGACGPPEGPSVNSHHEAPSLLSFTGREDKAAGGREVPDNLSELLTRKFREFFP
jgi:hypothetical protein